MDGGSDPTGCEEADLVEPIIDAHSHPLQRGDVRGEEGGDEGEGEEPVGNGRSVGRASSACFCAMDPLGVLRGRCKSIHPGLANTHSLCRHLPRPHALLPLFHRHHGR